MNKKLSMEDLIFLRKNTDDYIDYPIEKETKIKILDELISFRERNDLLTVATAAMQGILSNETLFASVRSVAKESGEATAYVLAVQAEAYALALIAKCEKERNDNT